MRGFLISISFLFVIPALGQSAPPPCGEKGVPDNVPCYDAKSGKVIHTATPAYVPHKDIPAPLSPDEPAVSPPPSIEPVVVPKTPTPSVGPFDNSIHQASPYWSYERNASCFHDGSTVQCFETGTLQRYATNRADFQAQFQAGQVIGEAIGALIRAWIAHRRMVDLERKNTRQQISAYYQATFELNDEVMHEQDKLVNAYTRLAQVDPIRQTIYEQAAKDTAVFKLRLAALRPTTEKNLPGILAAKDLKYLQNNLELAKKFYDLTLDGAKKEYVYSELLEALVGRYEHQQKGPEPAITPKAERPSVPIQSPAQDADNMVLTEGDLAGSNLEDGLTLQLTALPNYLLLQPNQTEKVTEPGLIIFRNADGTERLELDWTPSQHARSLMEQLRIGIYKYQPGEPNLGGTLGVDEATAVWPKLLRIFCRDYPGGRYIDLHGQRRYRQR